MQFDKRKKYIAAVSGGPDSMALLDKYHKQIVGVCHVNYHKRADSSYDTLVVATYCAQYHIPLEVYDVVKSQYTNSKVHNFQTFARNIRYDFFANCSRKFHTKYVLTGHNLNDFLETAVMQQKRNSLNYFYGIRPVSKYKKLIVYRPLISEFKEDLETYCKKRGIAYAIDSSNSKDIYERNRVRKELNKKSRSELKKLYKQIQKRNKIKAWEETRILKNIEKWKRSGYSLSKINSRILTDGFIYLFLRQKNIATINSNKIQLVKKFLLSNKGNKSLRLEDKKKLTKQNGKIV